MALDRRPAGMTGHSDVRRHVAFRAYGAMRMLDWVQAALEDVEGAVGHGQYGVAAFQARETVLQCLSIRSLARAGEIEADGAPSFDFFAGLDEQEVAAALQLAGEAVNLDEATAGAWLERLQAYVAETERLLGLDAPLPILRSPQGPFGLIALARHWGPVLDELDLPPLLLPSRWVSDRR